MGRQSGAKQTCYYRIVNGEFKRFKAIDKSLPKHAPIKKKLEIESINRKFLDHIRNKTRRLK